MMRYKLSVLDFIGYGSSQSFDTLLELAGTYNEETITIASASTVKNNLIQLFGERCFYPLFSDAEIITPLNATDKVKEMYATWKAEQLHDLLRAFYALKMEYEPLDNYNGYEKTEITYGKTTDTTYGKTEDTTHGKTNTLETDIFGYNSDENGAQSDKVSSTDGGTTGITYGGTDGVEEGGTETHEITKRGNLGLTSSQQMVESEWKLRKKNFVLDVIRDFVDTYTCY